LDFFFTTGDCGWRLLLQIENHILK
jgi:hypothetical protein